MDSSFKGIDEVLANFSKAEQVVIKGVKGALDDCGDDLLSESSKEVPFEKGTLSGSGRSSEVGIKGNEMKVEVSYNTPYAARLHEHPEYKFKKSRKGKYLEDPLKRRSKVYKDKIEGSVRKATK
ncbi:MAG: HK97 gp10 family phage protein [Proteobacteria bacterium]|jgi:hypothetical protein|nr:HK97 gp10 family phage protein [Pseudomonadota bacterium]